MRIPFLSISIAAAGLLLPLVAAIPHASAISLPKTYPTGKVCRAELGHVHWHAANGAKADKMEAQIKAILDWKRFTRFEYGRRWSYWSLAVGHKMTCVHDGDAGVWRCRAEAQPCKS